MMILPVRSMNPHLPPYWILNRGPAPFAFVRIRSMLFSEQGKTGSQDENRPAYRICLKRYRQDSAHELRAYQWSVDRGRIKSIQVVAIILHVLLAAEPETQ